MIIVHLLAPAVAGGLERVVQALSIGQLSRGHRVIVAAVVAEPMTGHPFIAPLERNGVEVRELVVPGRGYRQERRAVAALCASVGPDVVHSHGYHTNVVDGGVIRRLGVATVATCHGNTEGPWRNRLYEALDRRALRRFDGVIVVSRKLQSQMTSSGVPSEHVHLVPNAWSEIAPPLTRNDARAVLELPDDRQVLGWVGRMSREKGIDVFVDAMALLDSPEVLACAVGDGPEREIEQSRATALLGARMHWAGMRPEAGRLARAFDLFVLSSRTEGVPIALLEAVAAGTPVVATRVGGVPDILSEQEAWLVPPEQPAKLAGAIAEALADPAGAALRAAAAKARIDRDMGREPWLDRHDEIYETAKRVRRSAGTR